MAKAQLIRLRPARPPGWVPDATLRALTHPLHSRARGAPNYHPPPMTLIPDSFDMLCYFPSRDRGSCFQRRRPDSHCQGQKGPTALLAAGLDATWATRVLN